jgi:tetratricopeptide (TPR) repeat protein
MNYHLSNWREYGTGLCFRRGAPRSNDMRLFALAADWVRSAIDLYHRREYENAERIARAALEARPTNADVRAYLIRALIKQGQHDDAITEIGELRRLGESEEAAFLDGFLARHQGRFSEAVVSFESSRQMGRRGVALDRELANCYLELGDVEKAKERVEAARLRQADNPFILDMAIRIACYEGEETTARDLLVALADVDDPAFYAFRKSRVELYFGESSDVLEAAKSAIEYSRGRPSFEIQAQLIVALAMAGNADEGEKELAKLKSMYPYRSHDVQLGLECRLQIVSGRFDHALGTWERLDDKRQPVHLRLRRDALQGLLEHTNLTAPRRSEVQGEVAELDGRLANVSPGRTQDIVGGIAVDT